MNTLIISLTVVVSSIGVGVAIWSIVTTRKKYFNEYLTRKRDRND